MRFINPLKAVPGPSSMNRVKPCASSTRMDSSQRTDAQTCSTSRPLVPVGVPCGRALTLEITGMVGAARFIFASSAAQFRLRAGHERRVIRARHRQRQRPFRAFGLGQFARLRDFFRFAGNHQLAGTVQIRQNHAGFRADFARQRFIQTDDRRHAASRRVAGFLHEFSALADDAQSILKTHRARRRQRREFTERQTGGRVKFQVWRLFLEQFESKPSSREKFPAARFRSWSNPLPAR